MKDFQEGLAIAGDKPGNYYAIDKTGKKRFTFPKGHYPLEGFSNGFVVVSVQGKHGTEGYNYVDQKRPCFS